MNQTLTLTHEAIAKARERVRADKKNHIRLGLASSGCAGYEYVIEYADSVADNDVVLNFGEFNIVIDQNHEQFFRGAQLDWVQTGLNQNFKIVNPNETYSCGCGASVTFQE